MEFREQTVDDTRVLILESAHLVVEVAPSIGGRITSLVEKRSGHQFLWRNGGLSLRAVEPGSPYDPHFYGGIDEVIPNDIEETVDGVLEPDHGELWTLALDAGVESGELVLRGTLPLCGLHYERRMGLRADSPHLDVHYRLENPTRERRRFLWKLHAALSIQEGDVVECPARRARVADAAWSRHACLEPFDWPVIDGARADVVPAADGTTDFLFLYDLEAGELGWRRPSADLAFGYTFDPDLFPYACCFASYGGLMGHYTTILEPCTAMPVSVNEAAGLGQCTVLEAGAVLETTVMVHAGQG